MLRIACPFCGIRDHDEFTYLEDAAHRKPDYTDADMKKWYEAVYLRDNPRGKHVEYWHHALGCRMVLKVTRDTVTHDISKVEPAHPQLKAAISGKKPSSAALSKKQKA